MARTYDAEHTHATFHRDALYNDGVIQHLASLYSHGTFSAKTLSKQDVGIVADDIVLKEDLDEEDKLHLMHNSHNLSTLEST